MSAEEKDVLEGHEDTDGSIDKIRQILFGVQLKSYDERLAQLEAKLSQSINAQGESMAQQVADVTRQLKGLEKSSDKVVSGLQASQSKFSDQFNDKIDALSKQLQTWLTESEQHQEAVKTDLQGTIGSIEADLTQQFSELQATLKTLGEDLAQVDAKHDGLRSQLSDMFRSFADHLGDDGQDA
ncbi:MAG: hypothetical protein AB8F65_01870 [Woeseiaceae bacterium]